MQFPKHRFAGRVASAAIRSTLISGTSISGTLISGTSISGRSISGRSISGRSFSGRFIFSRFVPAVLIILVATVVQAASSVCVHFDVPQIASCRPVTPPEPSLGRDEQIVEATFDVSTLLRFGHETQVRQLLFVIESPAGTLRVLDYAPRTELTSLYVGNIERNQQREASNRAGITASFKPTDLVSAQGNLSHGTKANESIRFQTVAPMQLLAASGTVARGTAVYFKFKSTPQTTLDGSRQLRVTFRVPKRWRGDYVYVRCVAYADSSSGSHPSVCGSSDFLVPLFVEGDELAREAAHRLGRRELELRQLAKQLNTKQNRSRGDSLGDKLTAMFRDEDPQVPKLWLTTVLTSAPIRRQFSFQRQLPSELRRAVTDFTDARWQLAELSR